MKQARPEKREVALFGFEGTFENVKAKEWSEAFAERRKRSEMDFAARPSQNSIRKPAKRL